EDEVLNISGNETGDKVQCRQAVYGVEPNDHAIYLDVKQYLANQRQGTHKTQQSNEMSGSTTKSHEEKGTGADRAGSINSPLFHCGGRIFGPQPRDYSFKLNKKLKVVARKSALSYKAKDSNILVLDEVNFDSIKTKNYAKLLADLNVASEKTLMVLPTINNNV